MPSPRVRRRALILGLAVLTAASAGGAWTLALPQNAQAASRYQTLLNKRQVIEQQIDFMVEMIMKSRDAKLRQFIQQQLQALLEDLRRNQQALHDTCERAAHPKNMDDQIERLARETEFRKQNVERMSKEGLEALGGSAGQKSVDQMVDIAQDPFSVGNALQKGHDAAVAAMEEEGSHVTSSGAMGKLSMGWAALVDAPMQIYNAWKEWKPFIDAVDRRNAFYDGLEHCPPPPPDESDQGTPDLRPFPPPSAPPPPPPPAPPPPGRLMPPQPLPVPKNPQPPNSTAPGSDSQ
ncbi:MAG TPA: hypothetical protein VFK80_03370, partial [Limnochordia bacterium]|nr:hypothetical protein [Limnochordia bacterium]